MARSSSVERSLRGLSNWGHTVGVYHRGQNEPEEMVGLLHIHGDNIDVADQLDSIKEFAPDAVIDTTQFDTPRTQAVVDALTGVIDRYVLVSSMGVYLAYGRLHRTEPGPHQSLPLTEESELRTLPGFGLTEEIDNLHIERVALGQDRLGVTIARLPAVFGPYDKQRRIGDLMEKLEEAGDELKLHPVQANFRWPWGYVSNVANMLIECALDRRPGNRIYNLGYPEGVSSEELYRMVAESTRWDGSIVITENRTNAPKQDLTQHWIADTSMFRRDFDYSDRVSMKQAIQLAVEAELTNG